MFVARYLRASFTVTNTHAVDQPAEVRGGRGSDSAKGVLPPLLALSIFPSTPSVTSPRLADILRLVYLDQSFMSHFFFTIFTFLLQLYVSWVY
jgi:hypothetical protein